MDTFENSLPIGTVLDNRYKIESVLGEGGFGITYKAHDEQLDYTVVIKEFLPQECAARSGDSVTVQARTNRTDDYQYGLERFLDEARNLAKFQHLNIVRVSNFINTNGTVYFVMDYAEGEDLSEWLKNHEVLNEDIILKIVTPILEGLAEVHKTGLLHRDIKPGNIFMRKQGGPMLIDFGAARQALGEHSKSISAIISQGYAPPEQYTTRGKQGAFTDLYAIGATLYKLITGKAPLESADRAHDIHEGEPDPMVPATEAGKGKVGDWLLQLTDQMLNISAKDRPQNADAVLAAIKNKTTADVGAGLSVQKQAEPGNKTRVVRSGERFSKQSKTTSVGADSPAQPSKGKTPLVAAVVVVIAAIAGGGWWFTQSDTDKSVGMNSNLQEEQNKKSSKVLGKGSAILYVDSQPEGAEVYLDNILLGQTPYKNQKLPKGEHEIRMNHADAQEHKETLTLKDNIIVKKKYLLKAASGSISLFSTPEAASIYLDGKDTGKRTPATLENVATGERKITIRKDSYYPKETVIAVLKGKAIREDLTLEGGHLVKYDGEWLEPEEKQKRLAEAKRITEIELADAREAKRVAKQKAIDNKKQIKATVANGVSMILYGTNMPLAEAEKKLSGVLISELDDKGFVLSDPHERINDAYAKKFGSTNLDTLNFFGMSNDRALLDIIKRYPAIGAFSPFSLFSFKVKNENTTWVGHVDPAYMADIVGMQNTALREKYINHFKALDQKIHEVMSSTSERKISYKNMPSNPMMKFSFDIPANVDIQDWTDSFQEKYEGAFEDKGYLIAGYKNMKESWQDMGLNGGFDQYFVYSLISFDTSYKIFDQAPEAGAFGPSSMYFYVNKGERKLYAGMPKLAVWASATNLDAEKKELCLRSDREIMSLMKSL